MVYVVLLLIPLGFLCNLRHLGTLAPFRLVVVLFVIMNSPLFLPPLPPLPFSLFADFANVFAYSIVFYFDLNHLHLVK